MAQPWRFSIARGLNIAFGLLLCSVPFFADAVVWAVPDWIMHRATTAGLPWLAVMVTVSPIAAEAVQRIGVLYAIEAEIRGRTPETDERGGRRVPRRCSVNYEPGRR